MAARKIVPRPRYPAPPNLSGLGLGQFVSWGFDSLLITLRRRGDHYPSQHAYTLVALSVEAFHLTIMRRKELVWSGVAWLSPAFPDKANMSSIVQMIELLLVDSPAMDELARSIFINTPDPIEIVPVDVEPLFALPEGLIRD